MARMDSAADLIERGSIAFRLVRFANIWVQNQVGLMTSLRLAGNSCPKPGIEGSDSKTCVPVEVSTLGRNFEHAGRFQHIMKRVVAREVYHDVSRELEYTIRHILFLCDDEGLLPNFIMDDGDEPLEEIEPVWDRLTLFSIGIPLK